MKYTEDMGIQKLEEIMPQDRLIDYILEKERESLEGLTYKELIEEITDTKTDRYPELNIELVNIVDDYQEWNGEEQVILDSHRKLALHMLEGRRR